MHDRDTIEPVVEFRLLGKVPFPAFLELQDRLVARASLEHDGRIVVLMCEHPPLITVGRSGSRRHIRRTGQQLQHERLSTTWAARTGGCVLHAPGQLCIYPIVPLAAIGWTEDTYRARISRAIAAAFDDLSIRFTQRPDDDGFWGQSGQLAVVGYGIRQAVTTFGAYINVNPLMTPFAFVDVVPPTSTAPNEKSTMGCLLAERPPAARMSHARSVLMEKLAAAFGNPNFYLHTGHPFLAKRTEQHGRYAVELD